MNLYSIFILGHMNKTNPKKFYTVDEVRSGLPKFLANDEKLKDRLVVLAEDGYLKKSTNISDLVGGFFLTSRGVLYRSAAWKDFKDFVMKSIVAPCIVAFFTALITVWIYCLFKIKP